MPRLTLTASPRAEGRVIVSADGAIVATISVDIAARLGLLDGEEAAPELLERIRSEGGRLATFDRALYLLAARSRSARELREALLRKGEPMAFVDAAIERLTALGHLDDARFARQFTRSRVVGGGLARRRVRSELARRGIAGVAADEAIDEVLEDEGVDERALLLNAARKRLRRMGDLEPAVRRRRLYAWLARRGFDADEIARALELLLREDGSADAS